MQCRKATLEKKEGINLLQDDIKVRLTTLRRAEEPEKKAQDERAGKS